MAPLKVQPKPTPLESRVCKVPAKDSIAPYSLKGGLQVRTAMIGRFLNAFRHPCACFAFVDWASTLSVDTKSGGSLVVRILANLGAHEIEAGS